MKRAWYFVKEHRFDIIVTSSVLAFIYDLYFGQHTFSLTIVGLYILSYAADHEKSRNNVAERKKMLPKGLVAEDIRNIKFVKSWDETRKIGLVKYALVYGGIFFGFALCGIYSIAIALIKRNLMVYIAEDPSHMVGFIGYTYIAGVITGTVLYRLIWAYNEQKFIRLTDPLHE
ncbi:MAG TPA: hypothetical protein VHA56_22675 [Mucilaginibacter sp.]|nr:hypothetical protein [Mucilaginibacter sp.]